MTKKTISILGCGWLGKPLATRLIDEGYSVKGSTTTEEKLEELRNLNIDPYLIDINELTNNIDNFLDADTLVVAITPQKPLSIEKLTERISESPTKNVIFLSSTSVYQANNAEVTEESPLVASPLVLAENFFRDLEGFSVTIIRFGGLFGYDRKPVNFIRPNKEMKNPEGFVNLIHQDDCIEIITQIIQKDIWREIFNACSDSHPNRKEFYETQAKRHHKPLPNFEAEGISKFKIVSTKKLKERLPYRYKYDDLLSYED
ncbi:nucleoside-diphosphate-sugar epimerase [Balneicella halophila]|uniref:Nucleoside-diphosphate-sugar epimerase n=1 Tax=Balneicella halophila TaxID=1537566 RepID=A0A7L4URE1_BALHA|nr:NAD(P)-binding domain-containing protein [Balneicella halophila]PVX52335.1 nucleoside-diphosphate-sugar epimerase [Balneicella halophila]